MLVVEKEKALGGLARSFSYGDFVFDVGLVASVDVITKVRVEKVENAYPAYRLNYQDEMRKVTAAVREYNNIELLGRTGFFWYNNMDHSMEASLRLAAKLLTDD